jgi:hypothetical protein
VIELRNQATDEDDGGPQPIWLALHEIDEILSGLIDSVERLSERCL